METLSYRTIKVRWGSMEELCCALNGLNATRIISFRPSLPDHTSADTDQWAIVHYEYRAG